MLYIFNRNELLINRPLLIVKTTSIIVIVTSPIVRKRVLRLIMSLKLVTSCMIHDPSLFSAVIVCDIVLDASQFCYLYLLLKVGLQIVLFIQLSDIALSSSVLCLANLLIGLFQ